MTEDAVWGVGRYCGPDGRPHLVPFSVEEIEREAEVAATRLAAFGFGRNDIVLVVAAVAEAAQYAPYERAARALGGVSCTAEPSPFDARRSAAFMEQYRLRVVIGLGGRVLDGMDRQGLLAQSLATSLTLIVRPDAAERVAAYGFEPAVCIELGPALAVECPERAGAHVGAATWAVGTEPGGRVWVEPAPGRTLALGRVTTGVIGRVITKPCACGSSDPRVAVESGR